MKLEVALSLPQEAETVAIVRAMVANTMKSLGVTDSCVDDVVLALSEACTNVVEHAAPQDEYVVRLELDDHRCAISVTNTGTGFDAEGLGDEPAGVDSERGRGVAIMHAVMDHVSFRSEPERGTIVHLVKTIDIDPDGPIARIRRGRPDPAATVYAR